MSQSEEELVAAAKRGERAALVELLERHAPSVRASLKGNIDPRWQSLLSEDDVMQETYADAALSLSTFVYTGPASFSNWLRQIAQHNLTDAVRGLASQRRGGHLQQHVATSRLLGHSHGEDATLHVRFHGYVDQAIGGLKAGHHR